MLSVGQHFLNDLVLLVDLIFGFALNFGVFTQSLFGIG